MSQKLVLNPATGCLELIQDDSAGQTLKVIVTRACDSGATIGDIVHESLVVDNFVEVSTDNTSVAPSIGIIVAKPTSTTAEVLVLGKVDGFSGLTKGKKVFLSTSGGLTSTPVATDYLQTMGYALSATEVFISPHLIRVKRL